MNNAWTNNLKDHIFPKQNTQDKQLAQVHQLHIQRYQAQLQQQKEQLQYQQQQHQQIQAQFQQLHTQGSSLQGISRQIQQDIFQMQQQQSHIASQIQQLEQQKSQLIQQEQQIQSQAQQLTQQYQQELAQQQQIQQLIVQMGQIPVLVLALAQQQQRLQQVQSQVQQLQANVPVLIAQHQQIQSQLGPLQQQQIQLEKQIEVKNQDLEKVHHQQQGLEGQQSQLNQKQRLVQQAIQQISQQIQKTLQQLNHTPNPTLTSELPNTTSGRIPTTKEPVNVNNDSKPQHHGQILATPSGRKRVRGSDGLLRPAKAPKIEVQLPPVQNKEQKQKSVQLDTEAPELIQKPEIQVKPVTKTSEPEKENILVLTISSPVHSPEEGEIVDEDTKDYPPSQTPNTQAQSQHQPPVQSHDINLSPQQVQNQTHLQNSPQEKIRAKFSKNVEAVDEIYEPPLPKELQEKPTGKRGKRDKKKEVCKYWLNRNCQQGENCPFLHEGEQKKSDKVCKFFR